MRRIRFGKHARWWLLAGVLLFVVSSTALVLRPQDCPSLAEFLAYQPPEASRVFAADGSKLADLSTERRIVVKAEAVPDLLRDGFIAVEDRRFYRHDGVDMRGLVRAVVTNLKSLSFREGFSTITMQLARSTFAGVLPRGRNLHRKFCEVQLAGQIESRLEKADILHRYVNQVYLGGGLYGVEAASRALFGKSVAKLDLSETALLIGLVKNPEGYNPRRHPERARQRRDVVLEVLADQGVVSREQADAAKRKAIRIIEPVQPASTAPWAVAAVRAELAERFGPDAATSGYFVFTGIEPELQRAAEQALVEQIRAVEAGRFGRYRHDVPGDELEPANGGGSPFLQGMVIVLDANTGVIRALVGGRDYRHSSYDRARVARRQPGSAFKPIVYFAALREGLTLADRIDVSPVSITGADTTWQPADAAADTSGAMTVRRALARSSNNAAIRVGQYAGIENVIRAARDLGITTPIPAVPSIFLGAAEVVPAEFVAAYATLANGGMRVRPQLIERIEDAHGRVLWAADHDSTRVADPATAFLAVSLMQDVVNGGTGWRVRSDFAMPAAGKTGTTNDSKDVWFVGATRDLAAGVWIGFDEPRTILPNATGGVIAAPVWARVMAAAYENKDRPPPPAWTPPWNVVRVRIDTETGQLAESDCPDDQVRDEFFLAGTEPEDYCRLHSPSGIGGFLRGLLRKLGRIR